MSEKPKIKPGNKFGQWKVLEVEDHGPYESSVLIDDDDFGGFYVPAYFLESLNLLPGPVEPADRDRILVTACKLIAADETIKDGQTLAGYLLQLTRCGGAKPYEVKERTNEQ